VSILYCFVCKDVRDAIRRQYLRYTTRRSANSLRRNHSYSRSSVLRRSTNANSSLRPRAHFRTKLTRTPQLQEVLSGETRISPCTTPELVSLHNVGKSKSPSQSRFRSGGAQSLNEMPSNSDTFPPQGRNNPRSNCSGAIAFTEL